MSDIIAQCLAQIDPIIKEMDLKNDFHPILSKCFDLTSNYDESHDINHHVNVFLNAIEIYESRNKWNLTNEEHDIMINLIVYASLLHDTIDHKYPENLENKIQELDHFLESQLNPEQLTHVKWIINNISYSKENKFGYPTPPSNIVQIARDIVSDADKIEAYDISRCRAYTLYTHPLATESEIVIMVIQHCHEKLLRLKDEFIRTASGKKMAEYGHQQLLDFVAKN